MITHYITLSAGTNVHYNNANFHGNKQKFEGNKIEFRGPYDKQNPTLMIISYEIY